MRHQQPTLSRQILPVQRLEHRGRRGQIPAARHNHQPAHDATPACNFVR